MKIEIKFRDTEARAIRLYLAEYFNQSKQTSLETLAKMAIRRIAAEQAEKELKEMEGRLLSDGTWQTAEQREIENQLAYQRVAG